LVFSFDSLGQVLPIGSERSVFDAANEDEGRALHVAAIHRSHGGAHLGRNQVVANEFVIIERDALGMRRAGAASCGYSAAGFGHRCAVLCSRLDDTLHTADKPAGKG
jgi:hypothetical protein